MIETDSQHIIACKRVKAQRVWSVLPRHYYETLEQNQLIASCCRHPENHDVEAWFSGPKDADRGIPDIYLFICTCGRMHPRFCVGEVDRRPFWDIRRRWWQWGRETVLASTVVVT